MLKFYYEWLFFQNLFKSFKVLQKIRFIKLNHLKIYSLLIYILLILILSNDLSR